MDAFLQGDTGFTTPCPRPHELHLSPEIVVVRPVGDVRIAFRSADSEASGPHERELEGPDMGASCLASPRTGAGCSRPMWRRDARGRTGEQWQNGWAPHHRRTGNVASAREHLVEDVDLVDKHHASRVALVPGSTAPQVSPDSCSSGHAQRRCELTSM